MVLRLIFHRFDIIDQLKFRVIILLTALPGLFMLYETGEHGAEMVFGYGVGTGQLIEENELDLNRTDSMETISNSTFIVEENGDWSWRMGPNAVSSLLGNFQWLEGTAESLNPTVIQSGDAHLLSLSGDSLDSFFTSENRYQNVQVDYYLNLSDFNGDVTLVNHVKDTQNYDFVRLTTDGAITQGRVSGGDREVFAEETYSASGMLFIRTVANGTHFRGYINKEMVVHGHGDAPEPGMVGIAINGSGTLLIDRMELTQLK